MNWRDPIVKVKFGMKQSLLERLSEEADAAGVSLSKEIQKRLEESFSDDASVVERNDVRPSNGV